MNLSGLLLHNLQIKLLSIFLAINIWLFVYLNGEDRIFIPVRIEFAGLTSGLSVMHLKEVVTIEVEGARVLLMRQRMNVLSMTVDLSSASAGKHMQKIDYGGIKVLKGLKVVDILPKNIRLEIK